MCATPPTVLFRFSWNFTDAVTMLWRYAYMWFGYNPQIILSLFSQFELSHFSDIFTMKVNGQWVPCVRNSYSFMPIHLKLYMCYGHGLKICMWFGYIILGLFFVIFFHNLHFSHFFGHFSEWIEGTLCAQLLLQFYTDTFETLQTLWPCFEDMQVVGIYSSD